MKKPNTALEILKILAAIICGWFLWVCIFSAATPEEADSMIEPFNGACVIFGILTGILVTIILKYNMLHQSLQKVAADASNIQVVVKRGEILLDKANRVADKYMGHEEKVYVSIAHERAPSRMPKGKRIKNASQFQSALENYPELKANENIMELLRQIRESENASANAKIHYNDQVAAYNTLLHSFPANLISRFLGFRDAEFYQEVDDVISDEALGL